MSVPNEKLIYFSTAVLNNSSLLTEYEEYEPEASMYGSYNILERGTSDVLTEFFQMPTEAQRSKLKEKGETYFKAFLDVIKNVNSDSKMVKYFVLLIDGIIEDDKRKISILAKMQKAFKNKEDVIGEFMHFIVSSTTADVETKDAVCCVLGQLFATIGYKGFESQAKDFLIWLLNSQQSSTISNFGFSGSLMHLLKLNEILFFFNESNGLRRIVRILEDESEDMQICYNLIACVWLLSFKPACIPYFEERRNEAIEVVIRALQLYRREKIIRIVLYLFKNLCKSDKCVEIMLDSDLLKEINNLLNRHWVDKDIVDNLEKLEGILNENYKVLNTFERLQKQIFDGLLKWGPMHSDVFWSEHFKYCEDNDFQIIKKLISLLNDDRDSTKAIACYDIGQFARYHPFGKNVLDKLGAKEKILILMESPNTEVRENALISIQKFLISDWNRFGK